MPTKNDILLQLHSTKFVANYTRQMATAYDWPDLDDIVAEIYLMLCELDDSFVVTMYTGGGIDAVRRYVSGVIWKQLHSCNSKVFYKYRRPRMRNINVPTFANLEHLANPDRVVTPWRRSADAAALLAPVPTRTASPVADE